MICFHRKWTDVDDTGYQYCNRCNKARYVGLPECDHVWEVLEVLPFEKDQRVPPIKAKIGKIEIEDFILDQEWMKVTGRKYVLQCSECGDIKATSVSEKEEVM